MIKRFFLLLLLFASILSQKALAVSIVLDGTQTLLSGTDCQTASYRLGTLASYQGNDIDLIVDVIQEDNEFQGPCVTIQNNVLSFNIKDRDNNWNWGDTSASMDFKVTVVKKDTQIPLNVDILSITNFDLDSSNERRTNYYQYTKSDDVYYKNPSKVYLSEQTNVSKHFGNYYNEYNIRLEGQTTGNCNDSATLTELGCRAGVIYNNTSTFQARVQNDFAYSYLHEYPNYYRLIQFSFELKDLIPLMSEVEVPCGTVNYSTSNDSWIEGTGHNGYIDNLDMSKTVKVTDAQNLKITINGETEHNFDWIYIYDENNNQIYVGSGHFNNKIVNISGSEVTIKLTSDGSETKTGVTVTIEGIGCEEDPTVSIANSVEITEGDSGDKELAFTINLDNPAPNGGVNVQISPTNITANEGEDYTRVTSSIHFAQGESQKTVIYKIHGDTKVENNETFSVRLHNPQNAILNENNTTAIGTIINDDKEIFISIANDVNITEGNSGTKLLDFTIVLNEPAPIGGVMVQIQPHNITALEGEDYSRNSSSISFAEGEQEKVISYTINGDTKVEDNETFSVEIHNPQHAKLDENHTIAIATIVNDDTIEIQPELVANYTFDSCLWNGNQDEVKDSSTNGFHGQAENNATTQKEHKINRSAIFKSANHQYVKIDGFDDVFGTTSNEFSFTAWIKPKHLNSAKTNHKTQNTIIAKASDGYNDNIEIGVNQNGTLHLYLDTNSKDTYKEFGESGDIDTNSWHFIAVIYKNGVVEVTIDDKQYTNSATWNGASNIDQALHSPVTIGASIHVDNYFDGAMDEVKIFSTALSNNQVSEILNNEESGKNWDGTERESTGNTCDIEPTGCITTAFMFQGRTDVYALNLANGDMPAVQNEPINIQNINAVGFNKKDGFFWGYNYDKQDGTIAKIGMLSNGIWSTEEIKIEGLEGFASYVGDVDSNSHLYLKGTGNSRRVVVIDLDPDSSTYLTKIRDFNLNFDLGTADWAFNPKDNMLYAVNNGSSTKYLYKIDPSNGHQLSKKDTLLTGSRGFGAGFFDANGFYYVYDNSTGEIFRIDISNNSSKAVLFSTTNIVSLNDGAMCTDAEFKFDFGDLPNNYPTLLESDGARHSLPTYGEPTIYLGSGVTHEDNGKPSINADLDSNDDGVKLNGGSLQGKTIDAGATTTLTITTHGEGYLSAWIDWNADGDFDDNLEQIASNIDGSNGLITLNVTAPSSAIDRTTYARFRYSNQENLHPTGNAINGEVEDYKIAIHGNLEAFECSQKFYLSNRSEVGTGSEDSGATWLHSFHAMTPVYHTIGTGFTSDNGGYNAIGYNIKDNFIYALYGNQLLKIDKNANVKNLGTIEGLPNTQLYAGEFDRNGFYYVTGHGGTDNKMYKIDVAQKSVIKTITLSSAVRFWDMAIDTTGNYFYTMLINNNAYKNDKFAKIDIESGNIITIGDSHDDEESYISLMFSDGKGKVIAIANEGGMYDINPQTGVSYKINTTPTLSFYNDGTSCPDANFTLPPHLPRLSIGDVTKAEGDSGITNFEFEVSIDADLPMMPMGMPAMFFYKILDGDNNDITINALDSDHDFKASSGIGMNMNIFSNNRSQTISVPVYGDTKVEKDEKFYVEIYFPDMFPSNFVMMGKDRAVGTILNDDMKFKVVRTNGDNDDDSLYTQITGRDFDYSLLSEGDINIDNMTLKIELIDNNRSTNNILYRGYSYIESGSRKDIINSSDLALLRATKDASFRVSFLKDENGTIVHGDYANEDDYSSIENRIGYTQVAQASSDHFAIRPAGYKVEIQDVDDSHQVVHYRDNSYSGNDALPLVAEYNYKIDAKAIAYDENKSTTLGYTNDVNATLKFDGKLSCNDINDSQLNGYKFNNGQLGESLTYNNFGKYLLKIIDNSWSDIDKNSNDCIEDSSIISENGNEKSGCNISTESMDNDYNIKLQFQPFQFDMTNTTLSNIHGSGKEYLYMSNLNLSQEMGVKLNSTIIAKGKNGGQLSNFTQSCIDNSAEVSLNLDFSFLTDKGQFDMSNYAPPKSVTGKVLNPQEIVMFNKESNNSVKMMNPSIANIKNKFLDENNGTLNINVFYNMEKLFREPTNPIKVSFVSLDLNTTNLEAKVEGKDETPIGQGNIKKEKTFYFARVSSYVKEYPTTDKKSINTPLFVEIFCKKQDSNESWCKDTMKLGTVGEVISSKTNRGWYLAKNHDSNTEGKVSNLVVLPPNDSDVSVTPMSVFPPFVNGKIKAINTHYLLKNEPITAIRAEIAIDTDVWLRFNRRAIIGMPLGTASYFINIKAISSTTGAGDTGNLIETVQKTEHNGKISW